LLAICDLGSLSACADSAKQFETDVGALFGACAKTWSNIRFPCSVGMGKNVSAENKENRFAGKNDTAFQRKTRLKKYFSHFWIENVQEK